MSWDAMARAELAGLTERQLDGFDCIRCGQSAGAMVPAGIGPRGQLFAHERCPEIVVCMDCGRTHPGPRAAARADHWEPYSARTQQQLDAGPMVCPACIGALLDGLDVAMRAAAARGVDVGGAAARILNDELPNSADRA